MRTVYKYPLVGARRRDIIVPKGSNLLYVNTDLEGKICAWFMVDTNETESEKVCFLVTFTGFPLPNDNLIYKSSFKLDNIIAHVFLVQ